MSLPRLIRSLPQIVAVVAALVVTAAPRAEAGIVQITDFSGSNGSIGPHGGDWTWNQGTQVLDVGPNDPDDYLFQQISAITYPDIAGAQTMILSGNWTPLDNTIPDGNFIVRLLNTGQLKVSASFSYSEFAGGQTVFKALTWDPSAVNTTVDQWELKGAGNSDQVFGSFNLTNLSVSTSAVPEIDPASANAALAMLFGSLGLIERRSRRLWIARRDSTPATAA
jgi:hypothetical protein